MTDGEALRIVQLNVGSLLEPDWEQRRHEILAWFERLDPDVVCLQEVWEDGTGTNSARWLVEHDRAGPQRWHWCFGGYPLPEPVWRDQELQFGSAILSRWPIEQHELLALPMDETAEDPRWHVCSELLYARTAGLDVFSTHLVPPPAQAYHRVRQVRWLDDAIRARQGRRETMPPLLCGDFNAEPPSDEIRFLGANAVIDGRSTYYQDAWLSVGHTEPGFTADPRSNPAYAVFNLPPKRIDYVFVGDPFFRAGGAGRILAAELAFDEPLTGILASDHYGLVVDVRWPHRPPAPRQ